MNLNIRAAMALNRHVAEKAKKAAMNVYDIVDRYHDRIRKFILVTVKDEWAADDLTQETFLRAQNNLASLRDPTKISAWLFQVAYNLCMDHLRSASRRVLEDIETVELSSPSDLISPAKELERNEMSLCVQIKALLLPQSYRTVLWLFDMAGFTLQETAEILSIRTDNAKVRLHRARKKLKAILEENCRFERDERNVFICVPINDIRPQAESQNFLKENFNG
jgi:RNA polymerase sigma-70 factor (ECF subfamily)